jgi:hypothetical protein
MAEERQPEASVGLAELIVAVRAELEKADAARRITAQPEPSDLPEDTAPPVKEPLLAVREVELEIQFEVTRSRTGEGGVDFKVVSVGGAGSRASSRTQRLRVLYGPAFEVLVSGDDEGPGRHPQYVELPLGTLAFGPRGPGPNFAGMAADEEAIVAAVERRAREGS